MQGKIRQAFVTLQSFLPVNVKHFVLENDRQTTYQCLDRNKNLLIGLCVVVQWIVVISEHHAHFDALLLVCPQLLWLDSLSLHAVARVNETWEVFFVLHKGIRIRRVFANLLTFIFIFVSLL